MAESTPEPGSEPPPASEAALARVRRRWETDPYLQHLGIEILSFAPGRAVLRLPLAESVRNGGQGPVHGGAVCSLLDIAIGVALNAANATAGEGPFGQTTTDINVSFLAGGREGPLTAEAQIIRRGRTLAVGEASVRDADGALVAVGRATFMIFRPEAQR